MGRGLFITDPKISTDPDESNLLAYGADARLRLDLMEAISGQAEASVDDTDKNAGEDYYQGGWQVGDHLNWNNSETGLLGVFGGMGTDTSNEEKSDFWLLGGEGQIYIDAATLYLQAGYFTPSQPSG